MIDSLQLVFRVRDSDPLGRRRACAAPLQERRGDAAGAHGAPCNIARPGEGWQGPTEPGNALRAPL